MKPATTATKSSDIPKAAKPIILAVPRDEPQQDPWKVRKPVPPAMPASIEAQIEMDEAKLKWYVKSIRGILKDAVREIAATTKKATKDIQVSHQRDQFLRAVVKANKKIVAATQRGENIEPLLEKRGNLCQKYNDHLWYGYANIHPKPCRVCLTYSDREYVPAPVPDHKGHYPRGVTLLENDGLYYVHDGAGGAYPVSRTYEGYYTVYLAEVTEAANKRGYRSPDRLIQDWAESAEVTPPWVTEDMQPAMVSAQG